MHALGTNAIASFHWLRHMRQNHQLAKKWLQVDSEKLEFMTVMHVSHKTMLFFPKVKILFFFKKKVFVKKKCSIWCAYPKSDRFLKKWSTEPLNTLFCTVGGAGIYILIDIGHFFWKHGSLDFWGWDYGNSELQALRGKTSIRNQNEKPWNTDCCLQRIPLQLLNTSFRTCWLIAEAVVAAKQMWVIPTASTSSFTFNEGAG